jgi:hypothetical protein
MAGDGSYVTSSTPPAEIYGHIVWLAWQIETAATSFTSTFQTLFEVLKPSYGTVAERASFLRSLLVQPGGLASTAATKHSEVSQLLQKMAGFATEVNAAAAQVQKYSAAGSQILVDANQLLGRLESDLVTLREASDEAYKKWRDYTISAVSTSVPILILSFGALWPLAVGLGLGLGVAAGLQRKAYEDLMGQIRGKDIEVQQKTQLVTDLRALNTRMPEMVASVSTFQTDLAKIESVWVDIGGNLNYIATNYTDAQLADLTFVVQIAKILDAQQKWHNLGDTAQQFVQNSLVPYSYANFGSALP